MKASSVRDYEIYWLPIAKDTSTPVQYAYYVADVVPCTVVKYRSNASFVNYGHMANAYPARKKYITL